MNGQPLENETLQNAIIINTCGEAVPIPTSYAIQYQSDYAQYCYQLGKKVNQYNWTWVSIVGYPFYYVTNTGQLPLNQTQNTWGIYGMNCTGQAGINAFLEGLDNQKYSNNPASLIPGGSDVYLVSLTPAALGECSYYGVFPSPTQTVTRALDSSIINAYNLTVGFNILNNVSYGADTYESGRVFNHVFRGDSNVTGSLFTIGVTRVPDTRLAALGILMDYNPVLYKSEYTAAGTSELVVLELGLAGGS
jgi:hypothetical protein